MQTLAVVGKQPSAAATHGSSRRRKATLFVLQLKLFASEVSMGFDPRSIDDSRGRDVYGHYAHLLKEDLVAASQQVKIPVAARPGGNVVRMRRGVSS